MRTLGLVVRPINGDGAVNHPVLLGQPEAIAALLVVHAKRGQARGNLGLKGNTKACGAGVVTGVQFNDAADTTGAVTEMNIHFCGTLMRIHASTSLGLTSVRISSNASCASG